MTLSLRVNLPKPYKHAFLFGRSRGSQDAGSRGYELLIDEGRLNVALVHFHPGNEIRVRSRQPVPLNRWQQITVTYDGSSKADGLKLYLEGEALETDTVKDHLTKEIYFKKPKLDPNGKATDDNTPVQFGARFRDAGSIPEDYDGHRNKFEAEHRHGRKRDCPAEHRLPP